MPSEAPTRAPGGAGAPGATEFGRVSRTRGYVFRYLLLGATLAGILTLAVLLALVAVDALRPGTADPGWFLVYGLGFFAPTVLTAGYFLLHDRAGATVGAVATGLPVASVLLGAALLVLFVDVVAPSVWFAYVVGVGVAAVVYAGYRRVRDGTVAERAVVFAVVFGYTLFGVPGYVHSAPDLVLEAPYLPTPWGALWLALALPAGAAVARVVARRRERRRDGLVAGALVATGALAGVPVALGAGVNPVAGVVLVPTVAVPTGLYVESVRREKREGARGLVVPVVVFGGLLLAEALAGVLGFAGPASWLDWQFLTSLPSPTPEAAGIYPALVGSVLLMLVVALLAFPVGVGAAVYLEEYAPNNRYTRFIQVNISNLAGVPSVVYGLLGLGIFINFLDLSTGSVLVGGMTLGLLILPIVVISAQEAIRSVPDSLRQASYGMGATRWQTIRNVVLPRALPGILTGTILALGRALGETAPLIMILAPSVTFSVPTALSDAASAMPLIVFEWAFRPQQDFQHGVLPAGVVTLLVVLLTLNSVAIVLRNRYQNEAQS